MAKIFIPYCIVSMLSFNSNLISPLFASFLLLVCLVSFPPSLLSFILFFLLCVILSILVFPSSVYNPPFL